jgi:hypothetical protein
MVQDLRLDTRRSSNTNIGLDELPSLKRLLYRTQLFLYWDFDWPFAKIRRDITLAQDQRYYDFDTDMDFERITRIRTNGLGDWVKVTRGITMDHYDVYDSDNGDTADPVERWEIIDAGSGEQLEAWPMPATDGFKLRLEGFKKLGALISDSDVCTLDDTLIVLFAASHLLTSQDDKLAQKMLNQANKMYLRMRGGATRREGGSFIMGGDLNKIDHFAASHITVNHTTS